MKRVWKGAAYEGTNFNHRDWYDCAGSLLWRCGFRAARKFFSQKGKGSKAGEEKTLVKGWSIGSPASGELEKIIKNGKIELRILPEAGDVYAPGGGKVIKIFPGGSALVLLLDCGTELKIEIGEGTEALEGMYFRTRVLKNEYVNKGKLILEYDVEKLKAAGYDPGYGCRS